MSLPINELPLGGVRIVDLTTVIMGPYATQILADLGAEVIKVEPPGGDRTRSYKPWRNPGMSGQMLNLNRNKQSVVFDLKSEDGLRSFLELISSADAVIHNLRPGPASRLGIGYARLAEINPRLVYCSTVGFGSTGPYANKPAYDDLIQAGSGLAALFGEVRGVPGYAPTVIFDKVVGSTAAWAVLAALYKAKATGRGSQVEVPMLETAISFMLIEHMVGGAFEPPLDRIGYGRLLSDARRPFRAADGYVCILPYSDENWRDFFDFVGDGAVMEDPRFRLFVDRVAHLSLLYELVGEYAARHTIAEWVEFCDSHNIPCMPVLDFEGLIDDPHVRAVGLIQRKEHPSEGPYRHVRSPVLFDGESLPLREFAPRLGEHNGNWVREGGDLG